MDTYKERKRSPPATWSPAVVSLYPPNNDNRRHTVDNLQPQKNGLEEPDNLEHADTLHNVVQAGEDSAYSSYVKN